jgi:hypothetical protein
MNPKMLRKSIAVSLAAAALGSLALVGLAHASSGAPTRFTDTVVGIEHVVNPYGDRFIMVRTDQGSSYGLWLSNACAATLHLGSDWPSAAPACN